jgi:hypothetical protein
MPAVAVQDSQDLALKNLIANIMGPPGVGKTSVAATLSECYLADKPCALSDMLWLLFDRGGLDCFIERGITTPVIDFSQMNGFELLNAFKEAKPLIKKRVEEGTTRTLVFDTGSVLDKILLAHHIERFEKFALYNAQLKEHMSIFSFAKSLPCNVLFLWHEKVITAMDEAAKVRLASQGLEDGSTQMDITGQALTFYRGNASMTLALSRQKEMNGTYTRWLLPRAAKKDTKTRFACLADREPAHLGQLFEKIRAASKF